jgi:FimV-like protein
MCCIVEEMELVGEEALWDFPSLSVSQTKIFARHTRPGMQTIIYSMRVSSENRLAMILPLPVAINSGEDAVLFHDLSTYPDFFTDLEKACFCEKVIDPFPAFGENPQPGVTVESAAAKLPIYHAGDYEASYIPSLIDFSRLDQRFRLTDNIWRQLPIEDDYGFAVFQLRTKISNDRETVENQIHPMAFEFRTRDTEKLFFPTVHVHDRQYHDKARFHHTLYCQFEDARAKFKHQRDMLGINYNRLARDHEQKRQTYEKYQSIPGIPAPVLERLENELEAIEREMTKCKIRAPAEVLQYGREHRKKFSGYDWYFTSRSDIQSDVDVGRCHGLLESGRRVEMMVLEGECVNRDVWLGEFIPQTETIGEVDPLTGAQLDFINTIPGKLVPESRFLQSYGYKLVDSLGLKSGNHLYLVQKAIDFGYSIYDLKKERNWSDYFLEVDPNGQVTAVQLERFKSITHFKELTVDQFIDEFQLSKGCAFQLVKDSSEEKYVPAIDQGVAVETLSTSLDIASAYINMGNSEEARNLLDKVLNAGNDKQKARALELLDKLA